MHCFDHADLTLITMGSTAASATFEKKVAAATATPKPFMMNYKFLILRCSVSCTKYELSVLWLERRFRKQKDLLKECEKCGRLLMSLLTEDDNIQIKKASH